MRSPLDSAFGQSLSAWVAQANQQLKEIQKKLEEYRVGNIEMNDDLREIGNKLAEIQAELRHQRSEVDSLKDNQQWVVRGILGLIIAAFIAILLGWQKIEYQIQHPPTPRSEAPTKPLPKL